MNKALKQIFLAVLLSIIMMLPYTLSVPLISADSQMQEPIINDVSDILKSSFSQFLSEKVPLFGKIMKFFENITNDDQILNEASLGQDPYNGYTLFGPEYSRYTYLIDMNGRIVHTWTSNYIQGLAKYLLENGNLYRLDLPGGNPTFRGGGIAGRVELFDEDSNLLWEYEYFNDQNCSHHDIEPLPNSNVLMIAWGYKTRDEAIASGRSPDRLRSNA